MSPRVFSTWPISWLPMATSITPNLWFLLLVFHVMHSVFRKNKDLMRSLNLEKRIQQQHQKVLVKWLTWIKVLSCKTLLLLLHRHVFPYKPPYKPFSNTYYLLNSRHQLSFRKQLGMATETLINVRHRYFRSTFSKFKSQVSVSGFLL